MSAGAFSDGGVAKAADDLVMIYVDCTERGANAGLMRQYGVRGYPSVVFLDPEGIKVGALQDRSAKAVKSQFEKLASDHTR